MSLDMSNVKQLRGGHTAIVYDPNAHAALLAKVSGLPTQEIVIWTRLYLASPRGSAWLRFPGSYRGYLKSFMPE